MKFLNKNTGEVVEFSGTYINSALVSAQNRLRMYWTNFEVTQPEDKGILLEDVIENDYVDRDKSYYIDANYHKGGNLDQYFNKSRRQLVFGGAIRGRYIVDGKRQDHKMKTAGLTEQRLEVRKDKKTNTLTTVQKDNVVVFKDKSQTILATIYKENAKSMVNRNKMGLCVSDENSNEYEKEGIHYRKLTPLECERLQTFDDGWTDCISNTQRYKALGNAWTVDVIAHILKCAFID